MQQGNARTISVTLIDRIGTQTKPNVGRGVAKDSRHLNDIPVETGHNPEYFESSDFCVICCYSYELCPSGMCAVRVAFGAFNVPSAANCLPSFMELHRQKFCNNQLEHRTTGERAHTVLNLSSEPSCSAADPTLHHAVMLVPLCSNYSVTLNTILLLYMATSCGLSLEQGSAEGFKLMKA
jgi:hypothetical protein